MSRRTRADLALVLVAFIWGATFVVVKRALEDISPILFLTVRFTLAAVLLVAWFRRTWKPEPGRWAFELKAGLATGFCLAAGYALQTIGLETTSPANTGFITGFYIPLVPILGALLYRRAPAWIEVAGVAVATAGIGLLTWPEGGFRFRTGDLLVLLGAVAFAGHILTLGHFAKSTSAASLSVLQIAVGAGFGWCTFWWIEPVRVQWTASVWTALAATALLATAVAFALQSWAQKHTTATRTALIFALEPVFAWLTSWWVTGEVLTPRAALGAAAVLAGILAVELRPKRTGTGAVH